MLSWNRAQLGPHADLMAQLVTVDARHHDVGDDQVGGDAAKLLQRLFTTARGEHVVLVQCDLGAISALLHLQVAHAIVQETGVSVDRLLIGATHMYLTKSNFTFSCSASMKRYGRTMKKLMLRYLLPETRYGSVLRDAQPGRQVQQHP